LDPILRGWRMAMANGKLLIVKPDYRYFPIGMSYVISAFEEAGIEYDFVDMYLDPNFDVRGAVRSGNYYAIASAGLIGSFTFFRQFYATVKEENPRMPTLLAGNITWDFPTGLLFETVPCDYLVLGEGEITGVELVRHMAENGLAATDMPGVAYRDPDTVNGFTKNPRREPLDLAAKAWLPTWDFFDIKRYGFQGMPILTGRGCTGRCSFCSPTNGQFRSRPMDHVFAEIDMLNSKFDFAQLHFMNEIFYPDAEHVIAFCDRYKKIKPHKSWHCLMRMDTDPVVLRYMRESGCEVMNVGVESGSDRVLGLIKKDLKVQQTRAFIQNLKATDLVGQASFMMANYGECEEDIKKTIDLLLELKISGPMALTINYPGTLNYKRARRQGLIPDELAYIESLDKIYSRNYFQVISGHLGKSLTYLNLSAMNDPTLFHVVEREMRRYYTDGFHIEKARVTRNGQTMNLEGVCPFCGNTLCLPLTPPYVTTYEMVPFCNKCGAVDAFFSPFDLPEHQAHYTHVAQALQSAKRVVVIAPESQARRFLMYNHFSFDFNKLLGFAAYPGLPLRYALNHPVRPLEELLRQAPDLLLVLPSNVPSYLAARYSDLFSSNPPEDLTVLYAAPRAATVEITGCDAIREGRTLLISSAPPNIFESLWNTLAEFDKLDDCDVLVQQTRRNLFSYLPQERVSTFSCKDLHREGLPQATFDDMVANKYTHLVFVAALEDVSTYANIIEFGQQLGINNIYMYEKANLDAIDVPKVLLRIIPQETSPDKTRSAH
jgi:anaerobic magnesium-protoporphyrin IX monomethyl ester cyclase